MSTQLNDSSQAENQQKTFITRKLNKILESKIENDKETLDTLKILSGFYNENNLRNRRNLRGLIEKRSLKINEAFLQSFTGVKEVVDRLCEDINSMSKCCQDMMTKLGETKSQTQDLVSRTSKLQQERQQVEQRLQVTQAFLNHFQLTTEEAQLLRDTRAPLDEGFFKVLEKVKRIHTDCKLLLRSNQQTAGLEIMESMALYMESAAERLYRWIQTECRQLNTETPEPHTLLSRAFECLQERPVLFQYSLDECANARRAAVVRSFIDALTRGGPGGMPCPIELHSHDPLRYVGDMLAWVHQCAASEQELLESLLKHVHREELDSAVQKSLSHITEGLCRPFKMRIEQVVVAQHQLVLLYKLIGLIKFYTQTLEQLLGECQLVSTLRELLDLAERLFSAALGSHGADLAERAAELPPADLGPTEVLQGTLALLQDILASQSSAPPAERKAHVHKVVSSLVEPLLQACQISAARLVPPDMAVYLSNCCHQLASSLALFSHTEPFLEKLHAQMEAHLDTLVSEQASHMVSALGLGSLYSALQAHQPSREGPLATLPGCDQLSVQAASVTSSTTVLLKCGNVLQRKLNDFLCAPDSLSLAQSSLLLSVTQRQQLRSRSLALVAQAYQRVYQAVEDPANGYPPIGTLLPRTPDQAHFGESLAPEWGAAFVDHGTMIQAHFGESLAPEWGAAFVDHGTMIQAHFGESLAPEWGAAFVDHGTMIQAHFGESLAPEWGAAFVDHGTMIQAHFGERLTPFLRWK
ncbi:COG6 [Cordylochernes scorpioides]|uniref:Conserved oligomeric Golgi complex subunit 6 n=1 Tax=Cordylochernes scorpioides TaxID=51811 RepID=A0ABY6LPC0_9ARAC|nr:COG6 [Cordylochernes scorpioides]